MKSRYGLKNTREITRERETDPKSIVWKLMPTGGYLWPRIPPEVRILARVIYAQKFSGRRCYWTPRIDEFKVFLKQEEELINEQQAA